MTGPHKVQELVVKTVTDGSLVIIELNRPHLLNSLDLQMIRIVRDSLEEAESTDTCTCVLLRGARGKGLLRRGRHQDVGSLREGRGFQCRGAVL